LPSKDTQTRLSRSLVALSGIAWLTFQSLGSRVVSVLSQLVLAWLLSPATFGAVGLVYSLTTVISTAANFGIDTVLLQRHRTMHLWIAPAFWTSAVLGLAGLAATAALAPLAGALYQSPQFFSLAMIFAVSIPLSSLATVPTVLLRSRLNFRFVAIYNVIEFTALQVATVVLAWRGFGAFSFVIPTPVLALVRLIVFTSAAPYTLKRRFKLHQVGYLFTNGSAVFLSKIVITLVAQGDYFVLGLMADKTQVGIYYFSFRLATQSIWLIAGNISSVVSPMLVKFSGNVREQTAVTWNVCRLMAFTAIPACFAQGMLAEPLLRMLFGAKWIGAIPVVAVLSIGIGFDAITWITGAFLNARKEYGRGLIYYLAFTPLFFALVYVGARFGGAVGTAAGVAVYYAIMGPAMTLIVLHRYGIKGAAVANVFVRPTAYSIAALAAAAPLSLIAWPHGLLIVEIVLKLAIWVAVYLALMMRFNPEVLHDVAARFVPHKHLQALKAKIPGWA